MERRPNSDYQHIQVAVNNFFEKRKDFTVLGVEKAFSKYVANVFDGVSFEDYINLINIHYAFQLPEQDRMPVLDVLLPKEMRETA